VNISRFSIFYPSDATSSCRSLGVRVGGRSWVTTLTRVPFISRRIGIVAGNPVNIEACQRCQAPMAISESARCRCRPLAVPSRSAAAVRRAALYLAVLEESKVGFIYTNGDPRGRRHYVIGGDAQMQSSTLWAGNIMKFDAMYETSHSTTRGDDAAWGFEASLPNER